jgi:hypothetical protein
MRCHRAGLIFPGKNFRVSRPNTDVSVVSGEIRILGDFAALNLPAISAHPLRCPVLRELEAGNASPGP